MMMTIVGKDIELTKSMEEYLEEKLMFAQNFTNNPTNITILKDGDLKEIKFSTKMGGKPINITEKHKDFYQGVDLLKDRLFNQLTKRKEIQIDKNRKEARVLRNMHKKDLKSDKLKEENKDYIEYKEIDLKPMLIEEAALQMELLNFDFFIFLNGENMKTNVLYKHDETGEYRLLLLQTEDEHKEDDSSTINVPSFIRYVKSIPAYNIYTWQAIEEIKLNNFDFYPYINKSNGQYSLAFKKKKEGFGNLTPVLY